MRIYFFEKSPGIFDFFTLPLKIQDKAKRNPWIFHKIMSDPLEIPRPKLKTPGNFTLFFLGHPWKFHFVFNWSLGIPHAISLIPLEIPYHQPPLFGFFSGKAHCKFEWKEFNCPRTNVIDLLYKCESTIYLSLQKDNNYSVMVP